MKCLLCQTDQKTGAIVLKKNECFVLLCSVDPMNYDHYECQTSELKIEGWKESFLCNKCCKQIL